MKHKPMIGQRVILTGQGGVKEIGTVVPAETGTPKNRWRLHPSKGVVPAKEDMGVWVFSPTKGYASDYSLDNVEELPGGQL